VQSARESARRTQCGNQVRQISLAVMNYATAKRDKLPDALSNVVKSGTTSSGGTPTTYPLHVLIMSYAEDEALRQTFTGVSTLLTNRPIRADVQLLVGSHERPGGPGVQRQQRDPGNRDLSLEWRALLQ
jgi:hypothetical protein